VILPQPARFLLLLTLASTTALAAVGDLYITGNATSTTNGQIYRVNPSGGVVSVAGGLSRPFGLAVDFAGTFYTSDSTAGTITKITPQGVATPFASGLTTPRGMDCDSAGNLYIATISTITKITPDGTVSTFDSGFFSTYDITFDAVGNMYVDDFSIKRIYKYTPLGVKSVVTTLTSSGTTYGLEMTSAGDLFISQGPGRSIEKYSAAGVESQFHSDVSPYQPVGIESNSAGEIFIGTNGEVRKYSADGLTETPLASGLVSTGMMAVHVIPEPGSATLLGLAGLACLARRRR
jgi:streptogramin lyase